MKNKVKILYFFILEKFFEKMYIFFLLSNTINNTEKII